MKADTSAAVYPAEDNCAACKNLAIRKCDDENERRELNAYISPTQNMLIASGTRNKNPRQSLQDLEISPGLQKSSGSDLG